jgi:hypothetical protein
MDFLIQADKKIDGKNIFWTIVAIRDIHKINLK